MTEQTMAKRNKGLEIVFGVIDSLYEQIFKAHSAIRFFDIVLQSPLEGGKGLMFHAGHQGIPCGLRSTVE